MVMDQKDELNGLSNCSHSNGCVVQSHCGFNLHLLKTKDPMDGGAW